MAVIFYQILILVSILVLWFLIPRFSRQRKKWMVIAGAAWSVWSLAMLFSPVLVVIQLSVVWLSIATLFRFDNQKNRISALESHIQDAALLQRVTQESEKERPQPLAGRSHHDYLEKALTETRQTLCIFSGWATDYVIEERFDQLLRDALIKGVRVYVAFGWTSASKPQKEEHYASRARKTLLSTAEWARSVGASGALFIAEFPTHQKLLISDDQFVACGSHNWLSNAGYRNEERSYVFRDPAFVASERDRAIAEVMANQLETE